MLAAALLGALLLIVAEFAALFEVHSASSAVPGRSVATGSHHSYAMALIAVGAVLLALAFARGASRIALPAIGLLGVTALLIALLGDLPDAQATGILGTASTHFVSASATPSAGLYMETAGAVLLIITSGAGLLLGRPAQAGETSAS